MTKITYDHRDKPLGGAFAIEDPNFINALISYDAYNESSDEVTFIMFMNGDTMQVNCSYETMKKIMRCR